MEPKRGGEGGDSSLRSSSVLSGQEGSGTSASAGNSSTKQVENFGPWPKQLLLANKLN